MSYQSKNGAVDILTLVLSLILLITMTNSAHEGLKITGVPINYLLWLVTLK